MTDPAVNGILMAVKRSGRLREKNIGEVVYKGMI